MQFILPFSPLATDPARFGPKAANLATLGRAGLRMPDGFCLDADAYRHQVDASALREASRFGGAEARIRPAVG